MTKDDLASLSEDALFTYFTRNASYNRTSPPAYKYGIRLGSKYLYAGDTRDLFRKFRDAVRGALPQGAPA